MRASGHAMHTLLVTIFVFVSFRVCVHGVGPKWRLTQAIPEIRFACSLGKGPSTLVRNQILLLCIYLRLRRLASHVELLFLMCLSSNAIHTLLVTIFVFIVVFFCVGGAKLPR